MLLGGWKVAVATESAIAKDDHARLLEWKCMVKAVQQYLALKILCSVVACA